MTAEDTSPPARCTLRLSGDINRFLYGTHKPFAHKWAEEIVATRGKKTGYHSLPPKKTASARRGK